MRRRRPSVYCGASKISGVERGSWKGLQALEVSVGSERYKAKAVLASMVLTNALLSVAVQAQGGGDPLDALRHGPLVVWYVTASAHTQEMAIQAVAALNNFTPLNYTEHSADNFGQSVSSFGESATNFGVNSDSRSISVPSIPADKDATTATPNGIGYQEESSTNFGQSASNYGSSAGSYGMESGSYGETSGSFGQTAGSYGTEANNFGQDSTNFAESQGQAAPNSGVSGSLQLTTTPAEEKIRQSLRQAYPNLQMHFYAVPPGQLQALLSSAQGTKDYPDVLVGTLPAAWWAGMDSEFGITTLRPAVFYPNGVMDQPLSAQEVAILADAPHMESARAFALWMSEPFSDCPGCVEKSFSGPVTAAVAVARKAIQRLVDGEPLGSLADPELATNSSKGQRRLLATIGDASDAYGGLEIQVEQASAHGSLAAVALRVLVSTPGVFGVLHPLVVLRQAHSSSPAGSLSGSMNGEKPRHGPWKVLQLTLDLPQYEQTQETQTLMVSDPPTANEQHGGVKGVSLLSPTDGQEVIQMPQLLWENRGGAGLEVVEWQRGEGQGWSESRLYFVEDQNPTLRTQVMARFADGYGRYRWRVWSVGAHGQVKISRWSDFSFSQ
ncbi:MAG: hypothetical protein ACP5E5_11415 [Acidobacteriaceae bacterium]